MLLGVLEEHGQAILEEPLGLLESVDLVVGMDMVLVVVAAVAGRVVMVVMVVRAHLVVTVLTKRLDVMEGMVVRAAPIPTLGSEIVITLTRFLSLVLPVPQPESALFILVRLAGRVAKLVKVVVAALGGD